MQKITELLNAEVVSINANQAGDSWAISVIGKPEGDGATNELYFVDGIWHNAETPPSYSIGDRVRIAGAKGQDGKHRYFILAS